MYPTQDSGCFLRKQHQTSSGLRKFDNIKANASTSKQQSSSATASQEEEAHQCSEESTPVAGKHASTMRGVNIGTTTSRKRKADALGRIAAAAVVTVGGSRCQISCDDNSKDENGRDKEKKQKLGNTPVTKSRTVVSGRGSLSGWTNCPLCGKYSAKKYANGRGIAAHLHSIHTPWNPTKLSRKIQRRQQEEKQRAMARNPTNGKLEPQPPAMSQTAWTPSPQEIEEWDLRVLDILNQLERDRGAATEAAGEDDKTSFKEKNNREKDVAFDQNGRNKTKSYKASLPPFIQAAANGDLKTLQFMLNQVTDDRESYIGKPATLNSVITPTNMASIQDGLPSPLHQAALQLLNSEDRHKSTAEHWAAGGGHLECLKFLTEQRQKYSRLMVPFSPAAAFGDDIVQQPKQLTRKKARRREGKSILHYAARNGKLDCIKYLLEFHTRSDAATNAIHKMVNEKSGDGTTPLHMACYGGHPDVLEYLVQQGANIHAMNEWGCAAAHWAAMTISQSRESIRQLCRAIQKHNSAAVSTRKDEGSSSCFVKKQSQGHSPLHKAAQKLNRHVIEWMAQEKESSESVDDNVTGGGAGLSWAEKRAAGGPDDGGHLPSDIWMSFGGDANFANWMKKHCEGW